MRFTLITGRTVAQGDAMEKGKTEEDFAKACAVVELDGEDMEKLGVKDGETVKVKTTEGELVLVARKAAGEQRGVAFVPLGPWANYLIGTGTGGTGMPPYKVIEAEITPAPGERVLELEELLRLYQR
ncbi:MAG: hypothetical protein GXN98_02685 [Euryarchaeota archaeon]|nr:hypothetical protein [Euryarchaeota archaeon]